MLLVWTQCSMKTEASYLLYPLTSSSSQQRKAWGCANSGFGPRWKNFFGPPARADRLKIFTKNWNDKLSVAGWLGLSMEGLIHSIHKDTTEKKKNICTISEPLPDLWLPGNLCPRPPTNQPTFIITACTVWLPLLLIHAYVGRKNVRVPSSKFGRKAALLSPDLWLPLKCAWAQINKVRRQTEWQAADMIVRTRRIQWFRSATIGWSTSESRARGVAWWPRRRAICATVSSGKTTRNIFFLWMKIFDFLLSTDFKSLC